VREVQTATTLVVGWLPRVNHTTLAALLEPVQALGLSIAATVSNKQSSVMSRSPQTTNLGLAGMRWPAEWLIS
jgi:hypothetical protein